MDSREDKLLREYVKALLVEDDTGGAGYGGYGGVGGGGGYGMGKAPGGSLKSIFIDPFIDAGKVIKASGTKAILRIKTLAKVAIETVLTTMIPFLQSNYTAIFANEKEALKKLREKYKDAFAAVDKAYGGDAMLVSFMLSPEAWVGGMFAKKSPELVMEILGTLAVGNENLVKYFTDVKKRLRAIDKEFQDASVSNYKIDSAGNLQSPRGPYNTPRKRAFLKKAGVNAGFEHPGQQIAEAPVPTAPVAPAAPVAQDAASKKAEIVMAMLKDARITQQIAGTPMAQQMKAEANTLVQHLSTSILQEAQRVLSAQSLQDIQKITGKPVNVPGLEEMQGPDRASLEAAVLTQTKAAMKSFYVTKLKEEIGKIEAQGVDPNNLYIKTLNDTLSKVSAL